MKKERTKIDEALDLIANESDLSKLFDQDGILKRLTKGLVERALEGEMKHHLGFERHARTDVNNARNGHISKSVITENGPIAIDVPRDRNAEFEPALVPKRANRIKGLDEKVVSLYAKGMSVSDIQLQLQELYGGAEFSAGLIASITDEVLDEVKAWQNRPLDPVYPIVFVDCLVVKVRQDKCVIKKSVYVALGIGVGGRKEILGLWISESEGAKFWLSNFTELKNRGLKDILIACSDNLTGLTDAITAVYPKASHQLCIVHQIRNSVRYVSYKHRKAVCADLKPIYTATTEEQALLALEAFNEKWGKQYPYIAKSWETHWDKLILFLEYPEEIRRVIYTTNAIESLNSQLRKVTKNKRIFPSDDSVFKTMYLAIDYITKKWTMPIRYWNEAMAHFAIKFEDRLTCL